MNRVDAPDESSRWMTKGPGILWRHAVDKFIGQTQLWRSAVKQALSVEHRADGPLAGGKDGWSDAVVKPDGLSSRRSSMVRAWQSRVRPRVSRLSRRSVGPRRAAARARKGEGPSPQNFVGARLVRSPGATAAGPSGFFGGVGYGGAARWTDASGKLWLIGGYGYGAEPDAGTLKDLWVY